MSGPIPIPRFSRRWLRVVIPAALLAVILGGGALALAESETVSSYWDGLWWSLSLVTTVGFVGHAPTTDAGKIISGVLMVLGFSLMAMTTAAIASFFVREDEAPDEEIDRAFQARMTEELRLLRQEVGELRRGLDRAGTTSGPPG